MNASTYSEATDIDYFITNVDSNKVTPQWIVETYSQRNWVEVFYRESPVKFENKLITVMSYLRAKEDHQLKYPGGKIALDNLTTVRQIID